jgi:hypothetical protein
MLKLLALVTMVIDHLGYLFFPDQEWMRAVGRLAMPLFAYAIARGYFYSSRKGTDRRYLLQLALLALISQLPFVVFYPGALNMVFTWTLAVLCLMMPLLTPVWVLAAFLFPVEYGPFIVLLPVAIYYLWFKLRNGWLTMGASSLLIVLCAVSFDWPLQILGIAGVGVALLLERWDGLVRLNKWFFYAFYPAHIAVLLGVQQFLTLSTFS